MRMQEGKQYFVNRITFAGAMFLAIVAVSPSLLGLLFRDLGAIGLGGQGRADRGRMSRVGPHGPARRR